MKSENKRIIRNVTLDILGLILSIPTATIDGFINQKEVARRYSPGGLTNDLSIWISSLKQKGYIETKTDARNNNKSIKLTDKAKLKLLDRISVNIKTDNKLRFLSFDIPEEMRSNRDRFRRAIKSLGFVQIQKSLWVIDKNVGTFVEMAAKDNDVVEYVAYIISEKCDIDNMIKKIIRKNLKSHDKKPR